MASKSEEGAWSFPDDGVCDYSLDSEAAAAFLDASLSPMINFSHPTQQQRVPTTCSRASNTSGSDLARSTKVAPVPSPRDGAESDATSMRSSQLGTYSRPPTVPEDQDHLELGQWIVGPAIGSGESGKVRLVRHRFRSDELGALKMVRKFWPDDHKPRDIFREIDILRIVHHPHIIALKDVMESTNHLYMVTDYCECGSLFDHMRDNGILDRTEIRRYFSQLISAISHLKVLSIAHRDIKASCCILENLFLFEDMWGVTSLKLGDLGMSTFVPSGTMLETSCGSPHYAAPEVIAGDQYDGSAADVWSSGVVLYGLIARTLPFDNDNIPTLLNLIKLGDYKMHDSIQGEARDLIRQMVMKDTSRRISVEEIQRHPFVDQSLLSKDLQDTQFAPSRAELNIEVIGSMISLLRLSTMQEVEKAILDPRVPNPARYIYLSLLNMKRNLQERGRASMLSFSTTSTTFSSLRRSPSAPGSLGKSTPASSKRLRHVVSMIDSSSGSPPESFRQGTSLSSYSTDREYSLIGDAGDLPSSKTARPVLKKRSISLLARRFSLGLRSSIDRSPRHPSSSYRNSGHSSFQTSSSTSATQPGSDTPLRPGVFQRSLRYSSLGRAMAGKAPPESPTTVVTASPLLSPEGWNHSAGVDPTDISARGKGSLPRKRSWLLGSGTRRLSSLFSGSGFQTSSSSPDLKATAMSAMSRGDETEMSPSLSPQLDAANPVRQPTPLSLAHSSNAAIFRASPSALSPRGTTLTPPSCVPPVTPRIPFAPVGRSIRANGPAPSAGSHSAPSAFSPAIIGIPPNPKASSYNWVDSQNRQSTFQPEEPYLFPSRTRSKEWLGLGIDTLDLTSLDINDRLQDENRGLKLENALLKREVEFKDVELEKALKESRMYRAKMMQASNLQDRRRPALPR